MFISVMNEHTVHRGPRGRRLTDQARPVTIEVGKVLDARLAETPEEPILMILKSNAYLVCTPNRGVRRGMPYLYGEHQVWDVEFE